MKKNIVISVILSIITNIILPLAAVFLIGGMDAMGILLLILFTINPLVAIAVGILSGGQKVQWYLPIINAVIFLLAESIITGFDFSYVIAAAAYIVLGIVAAYITTTVKKKKAANT